MTRYDAILLLVATQILQMLRQLLPFVRFDGYHVLADLTGVPDLFARIGPILRGLVPWRPAHPDAQALKPWAARRGHAPGCSPSSRCCWSSLS